MKSKINILILTFLTTIDCSTKSACSDGSLINDGIQTLCIIEKYDEALRLYDKLVKNNPTTEGYLNIKTALRLFSSTSRFDEYNLFLERYLKKGGDLEKLHFYTNSQFYSKYYSEIEDVIKKASKTTMKEGDINIIEKFMRVDQQIRRNKSPDRLENIKRDSINQLEFKHLLKEKKYANYQIRQGLSLLLRHVSANYLREFKVSGLLNFYVSNGVISKEEYYDAVGYVSDDEYFKLKEYSKSDMKFILNKKRKKVGLLPIKLSPLINRRNEIQLNLPDSVNLRFSYIPNEIANYIEENCSN